MLKYNTKKVSQDYYFNDEGINVRNLSPLAKSVYECNLNYLKIIKDEHRVLEIGCGTESLIKDRHKGVWHGVDVIEEDRHGNKSICTEFASVDNLPFQSSSFDFIVSNQSIEHWFEYNVTFKSALMEINRVLKPNGRLLINFPIHLHGHKYFVLNDIPSIENMFLKSGLEILDATYYRGRTKYLGWLECGFPTIYLRNNSKVFLKESMVLDLDIKLFKKFPNKDYLKLSKRRSNLSLRIHHSITVVIHLLIKKIFKI